MSAIMSAIIDFAGGKFKMTPELQDGLGNFFMGVGVNDGQVSCPSRCSAALLALVVLYADLVVLLRSTTATRTRSMVP
jgi:hypothetical protein